MVHILASLGFMLVAFGSLGVIASILTQEQAKILAALGMELAPARPQPRHRVRVRAAARWQPVAHSPQPTRAAA